MQDVFVKFIGGPKDGIEEWVTDVAISYYCPIQLADGLRVYKYEFDGSVMVYEGVK